ncbi:uncharacterized protein A1O9_06074 [Exophiala aquamarina CBS 119918]|uniref:Uncharacterized protein n=1 Tax=Exophiala aquamarina CBS 119918 TaxID=1182545 RepID=A0A072PRK3_9EURO|nr:uncharacterized protein A1O9_06074 [Exophiala aquamarina CBS 119918]KEF58150.1 hypothetical protein A1O9_06074 [Exophiala aquamarina CBS 119918]
MQAEFERPALSFQRAVDLHINGCFTEFMLSTASYLAEAALPVAVPHSKRPDVLNHIYLPKIQDHSSTSSIQPTVYSATDTSAAIDEMIPKSFQPDQALEPADTGSDGTIGTRSTPYQYHDSLLDDDTDDLEDFFTGSKKRATQKRSTKPSLSQNCSPTASARISSAPTLAKDIPGTPTRENGEADESAHSNFSSPPARKSTRKQPCNAHRKRRNSNRSNAQESIPKTSKKAKVQEEGKQEQQIPAGSRSLRRRTIQQEHPYKYDKIRYDLAKSSGSAAPVDKVEDAVQENVESTQKQNARTKERRSIGSGKGRKANTVTPRSEKQRRRSVSLLSITSSAASPNFERTTLQIWLDGFSRGAAPVPLSKVVGADHLVELIIQNWGWKFEGQSFSYAIASFPWLSHDSNIVIRSGMTDSFQKMLDEVKAAPVWAQGGGEVRCEVKITVYVQA